MDELKRVVGKDIFGIIDEYCVTVLIYRKVIGWGTQKSYLKMLNNRFVPPKLRIYLDVINSPCVKPTDVGNLVRPTTPMNFLSQNIYFCNHPNGGGLVYNKEKDHFVETNVHLDVIEYEVQIFHPDVIEYFKKYGSQDDFIVRYLHNDKKILHLEICLGNECEWWYDHRFTIIDSDSELTEIKGDDIHSYRDYVNGVSTVVSTDDY